MKHKMNYEYQQVNTNIGTENFRLFTVIFKPKECLFALVLFSFANAITQPPADNSTHTEEKPAVHLDSLVYAPYLKDIIGILGVKHSDQKIELTALRNFRKANKEVRTRLDEIKRSELNEIKRIKKELNKRGKSQAVFEEKFNKHTKYLDHKYDSFGVKDLQKLIVQAHADLALMDKERHQQFKEYEMYKQMEYDELFSRLHPEAQKILKENRKLALMAHNDAEPLILPISANYLVDVWEQRDHMNRENFNMKTFFHLHDLDGDHFLDEDEIKVIMELLVHEYYDPEEDGYDPVEAAEELERLRELMFHEADYNHDHAIDLEEFIIHARKNGIHDHSIWHSLKHGPPVYTQEEYRKFKKAHIKTVRRMADEGFITMNKKGFVELHEENQWKRYRQEHPEKSVPERTRLLKDSKPTPPPPGQVPMVVSARKEEVEEVVEDIPAEVVEDVPAKVVEDIPSKVVEDVLAEKKINNGNGR